MERRPALLEAKLGVLVREHFGPLRAPDRSVRAALPSGAALLDPDTATAWALVQGSEPSLGPALAWSQKGAATRLHVLVDAAAGAGGAGAGVLARRAAAFRDVRVWQVDGRAVSVAEPEPIAAPPPVAAELAALADQIRAHGLDPVVEHGILRGEVLGLEVCRVVQDPEAGWRLEPGVGRNDRKAHGLLHRDRSVDEGLDQVLGTVREWRRPDVRVHPANTLAVERWLRAVLVARPELVGAGFLAPVPPVVERRDLTQTMPAAAAGEDLAGGPLLVVCATGIDLELVPAAADQWLADGRQPRLVLAVTEGNDHPATRTMAAALRFPAEVVTLPAGWKGLVDSRR